MTGGMKRLAQDTAIYGASSILGRFLNYLLVPLYTAKLSAASGGYGVITNIYAYTALLLVILTYGMETAFFRFANKENERPMQVYSTTLIMVGSTSLTFIAFVLLFLPYISDWMGYTAHPEYIGMMAVCVAIDAFQAIPFAFLRYKKRPVKFAALKLLFIFMNILLNLLYFVALPSLYQKYPEIVGTIYNPNVGVGYAFGLNLVCTAAITVFLWSELTGFKYVFDKKLAKRMLSYSWPILVLGIAGIMNQTADKIIFPYVYNGDATGLNSAQSQLGIYGACVKVAMIMAMITQAFRYAYEPFVFGKSKDKDSKETYVKAMKYFIIFTFTAFLIVMFYIDLIKLIILQNQDYWIGLNVVPIVMIAEIMMGIYFNLSFWYKLTDKTIWGAYFSGAGCIILITLNIIFIPKYSYMACAWAGVAGYGTAMLLSYFVGQKKYPISYDLRSALFYSVLTAACYCTGMLPHIDSIMLCLTYRTVILLIFLGIVGFNIRKDIKRQNIKNK